MFSKKANKINKNIAPKYPASQMLENIKQSVRGHKTMKEVDFVQKNKDFISEMEFQIKLKKSENEFLDCFKRLKIENFKKATLIKKSVSSLDPSNFNKQKKVVESNIECILDEIFKDA